MEFEVEDVSDAERASSIEIIHFNDVYEIKERDRDPCGGAARFVSRLNAHPEALVLFSGDALAPSLLSTITKGAHMIQCLNLMRIRAACMGNHDFDFGVENLEEAVAESNFPWLLSNAWDRETGERLAGGLETFMIEHAGRKIGLMGLIEEEWLATLATLERGDVTYEDFVPVARRLTAKLRAEGADAVIALTHMRSPNDKKLAAEVPELDLVLGGHDHDVENAVINGVPVIKSGTDFRNFSRIRMWFTDTPAGIEAATALGGKEQGSRSGCVAGSLKPTECSWELESVTHSDACDAEAEELVTHYLEELNRSMDTVIGELGVEMDSRFGQIRTQETNCSNWVADCILDGLNLACLDSISVDVVIVNSGTLRADDMFPIGPWRLKNLVTLLPMLDEMAILELSGAQLLEALENGVCMYPKLEGRFPCVAGVRFSFDGTQPAGSRVVAGSVTVRGEELSLEGLYRVATKNYLATGRDGYSVFAQAKVLRGGEELPMLADLLRSHLTAIRHVNDHIVTLPDGSRVLRPEDDLSEEREPQEKVELTPEGDVAKEKAKQEWSKLKNVMHAAHVLEVKHLRDAATPDHARMRRSSDGEGAQGSSYGKSPNALCAERNRRKQKMERLSRNIHLRSIDEAAEELQQSCNREATEVQQREGGPFFVRAPSHGSLELMDLVRRMDSVEASVGLAADFRASAATEARIPEIWRFKVFAQVDGRVTNIAHTQKESGAGGANSNRALGAPLDIEDAEKVVCAKKGAYATEVEAGKSYYWCTCGLSKNQPFCDGSHKGTTHVPMKWDCEESGTKYFCGCKVGRNKPFCNGDHQHLPADAEGKAFAKDFVATPPAVPQPPTQPHATPQPLTATSTATATPGAPKPAAPAKPATAATAATAPPYPAGAPSPSSSACCVLN